MKQEIRAVIYTRVSTEEQAERGTSLAGQLSACIAKAEELGVQVVDFYKETESGAYYSKRFELQKALTDLESGRANRLICYDISRLSRDEEHQHQIAKRVARANAKVIYCNQTFDDSPEGELAFGITGNFAAYERKKIRERSINGKRRRAAEGKMPVRTFKPYGYHLITNRDVISGKYPPGSEGTYEVIEDQARWVREVFHRYASGHTLRGITKFLYEQGVSTSQGKREWHHTTLTTMLRNPLYRGQAAFGKHRSIKVEAERTIQRKTDPSQWIYMNVPRLVSDDLWNACQVVLAENQSRFSGNSQRKRALTGLMRCPGCGGKMTSRTQKERRRKLPSGEIRERNRQDYYYHCPQRVWLERDCKLATRSYNGKTVESQVIAKIQATARDPRLLEAAFMAYQETLQNTFSEADYEQLQKQLAELKQEETVTAKAQITALTAGADPEVYVQLFKDLAERRDLLQRRLQEMERQREAAALQTLALDEIDAVQEVLGAVEQALLAPHLTPVEKHALLARVVDSIYPTEDGVEIRFKGLCPAA